MKTINKYLAGVVLSASFLFSSAAKAMPIPQFDKMTHHQQGAYSVFLFESAANILAAQGDKAGAARVRELFENDPGQPAKPAVVQYVENTNGVRQLNQQHANDPNFKPFEVEHALALTLKQNGIIVPVSKLLQVSQTYKPSSAANSVSAQNDSPSQPTPSAP
jgi:hypothetical protein